MGDRSKEPNPYFGKILRQLRTKNLLTQADIGKITHKGDSTVRMWELGRSEPDNETMSILADYFNVSVDYLLGRNENSPANNGEADNATFVIPEKYSGIRVALNEGDKNLTQDDIDDIIRFINFTANKK